MQQLVFLELLTGLGINGTQCTTLIGSLVARMAAPGSELAAHRRLGQTSGLGELLAVDYETLPLISLYSASDVLWKRHAALEHTLFAKTCDLFNLDTTVTLYEPTNTSTKAKFRTTERPVLSLSKWPIVRAPRKPALSGAEGSAATAHW